MEIKLSDEQVNEILDKVKADVFKSAVKMAKDQVDCYMRGGQFIGEIRKLVVTDTVSILKDRALKNISESELIERAVKAAEHRVNNLIHSKLKDGIVVSFNLSGEGK